MDSEAARWVCSVLIWLQEAQAVLTSLTALSWLFIGASALKQHAEESSTCPFSRLCGCSCPVGRAGLPMLFVQKR